MGKPRPLRIPSDGCEIRVEGKTYQPHEGEWVELISVNTVGELKTRVEMAKLGVKIDAIRGEPDEGARFNAIMDEHYSMLIQHLARRVFAWNWTDDRGIPLPPPVNPDGSPSGLLLLRAAELYWLMNASAPKGEAESERKND